jgi:hypothetical protein
MLGNTLGTHQIPNNHTKATPPSKEKLGFIIGFRVYYRVTPCSPRASPTWKFCSLEDGGPKIRRGQWELAFTSVVQCDKGFSHISVL